MYDRPTLSFDEALRGLHAALAEAGKDGKPVTVAIVDHRGDLVCYGAQDETQVISRTMAIQKAYTAALALQSTRGYTEKIDRLYDNAIELHLGPRATSVKGGIHIRRPGDGLPLGGIGVSGGVSAERDEEIGRLAIAAMGLDHA